MEELKEKQKVYIQGDPDRYDEIYKVLTDLGGLDKGIGNKLNDPRAVYCLWPNRVITTIFKDSMLFELLKTSYKEYKLPADERLISILRRKREDNNIINVLQSYRRENFVMGSYLFGLNYFIDKYTVSDFINLIRNNIKSDENCKIILINDATEEKPVTFFIDDKIQQKPFDNKNNLVLKCLYTIERRYKDNHIFEIHYY